MAKSDKSTRKGKTSFGKRSDVEKSFYNRKREDTRFTSSYRSKRNPTRRDDYTKTTRPSDADRPSPQQTNKDSRKKVMHIDKFKVEQEPPKTRNSSPRKKNTRSFDKKQNNNQKPLRTETLSSNSYYKNKPQFSRTDVVKKSNKTIDAHVPVGKARYSHQPTPSRVSSSSAKKLIRLNRFIANSGVGSRRQADDLIRMGLITVNGETITEMGHRVEDTDDVRYEGRRLKAEKPIYILLNKPKEFITTTKDPRGRNTVMSLVANANTGGERIYPVGRLDRNTTGLLLLTNDGDLAEKLTHPSYKAKKIYKVTLDKPLTKPDFQKILDGVYLEEGRAIIDDLAIVSADKMTVGIELHIGWNRIVRRIFESLGYEVLKLDRVVYAGLDKKDLGRGQWRFLRPEEIITLKHLNK